MNWWSRFKDWIEPPVRPNPDQLAQKVYLRLLHEDILKDCGFTIPSKYDDVRPLELPATPVPRPWIPDPRLSILFHEEFSKNAPTGSHAYDAMTQLIEKYDKRANNKPATIRRRSNKRKRPQPKGKVGKATGKKRTKKKS
jgi:hypothetical protein